MMVGLSLYAYYVGCPSSRQIERATWDSVPFRVLTADTHPDRDTIAAFRKRHLAALGNLFGQVLRLCRRAGLVRMGHVALDGTKMRANASKHKAMSADAGYFSRDNVEYLRVKKIDPWIATGKNGSGEAKRGRIPARATVKERMSRKLRTKRGRRIYGLRKVTVEPVFGQIKEARGFRRFLLRGIEAVHREWEMICLTHNLLKIYRHGRREAWA